MEGSRRTGLPANTEVMDERNLKLAMEAGVQMLQIGTSATLSIIRFLGLWDRLSPEQIQRCC